MSVLAPAVTQVGLQLLLQPYSNFIGQAGCTLAGVIYPAYASFKAANVSITRRSSEDLQKWLTYWAVYASFSVLERALDKSLPWVPYYHTLKFAFIMWLQLPRYQGAQRLRRELFEPLLAKARPHVDDFLEGLKHSVRRAEVLAIGDMVNYYLAKVPLLEWFVRGPDGQPVQPAEGLRSVFLVRGGANDEADGEEGPSGQVWGRPPRA